jgi:hypothetical protein
MSEMSLPLENALFQWEQGFRRLEELRDDARAYRRVGRAVTAIEGELRRRVGPTFTAAQLADVYAGGTDWAAGLAHEAAPEYPLAWDAQLVTDAAFYLYLRRATDFAGGRVFVP